MQITVHIPYNTYGSITVGDNIQIQPTQLMNCFKDAHNAIDDARITQSPEIEAMVRAFPELFGFTAIELVVNREIGESHRYFAYSVLHTATMHDLATVIDKRFPRVKAAGVAAI